ncbi:uncharacterized protein DNG_09400 [Cephalotrichum gorgonifer]|uniref:CCZ1/INTU/HSP4 first Longin domain-containing protein n=1 Tax=Cephalotrichum gorgonifer TaxID=2041049 RepID=A0AAE8SZ99_9PEZI|nr:uncharacterized protein DNG_09400 [Cephalotrichum gorgonifer]
MTSQITPARLGFLAIYNPSLSSGSDEDSIGDQIVYYASPSSLSARRRAQRRKRRRHGRPTEDVSPEERNERLRQIGLAQGMVEFSRGFSGGEALDVVETERTRVVVREIEPGWWVLSSIDLTRVPLPPKLPTSPSTSQSEEVVEYSSKDLKPPSLLLQDLVRAHSLFLLHHGVSLSSLHSRLGRRRFVSALTRYWDLFLSTWSVCLHGNPVRSVFGGINIAASGELGVGVGEEDRGSGEREVLEGLVGRIEGLVDVGVSKFAEANEDENGVEKEKGAPKGGPAWIGTGRDPGAEDGAIFLGTGALSKKSQTDLFHWMEDLYTWGENAYGVIAAPSSVRENTKEKKPIHKDSDGVIDPPQPLSRDGDGGTETQGEVAKNVPPARDEAPPLEPAGKSGDTPSGEPAQPKAAEDAVPQEHEDGHLDRFVNVLKLGYGTYWTLGGAAGGPPDGSHPAVDAPKDKPAVPKRHVDESEGFFLIGLKGTAEEHALSDSEEDSSHESPSAPSTHTRVLHVRLSPSARPAETQESNSKNAHPADTATPLRAVVYVIKPFIFTFLFRPDTPALSSDTLYRSLHYQLSPLRKPLLLSTAYRPPRPLEAGSPSTPSVYDLVFDPATNTTHSTIPNIPAGDPNPWTRAEAAATHAHLLSLYGARKSRDAETTARTNKGWWIVWSRVSPTSVTSPPAVITDEDEESDGDASSGDSAPRVQAKEVILLRRAGETIRSRAFSTSALRGGDGSSKLAPGIGVDTRGYIESLLSLGR